MRTKELIEELNKLDPEGNCEVNFGGAITRLRRLPWYYNGACSILIRNDEDDIIGMRQANERDGDKINIYTITVDDLGYKVITDDFEYIVRGDEGFLERYQMGKDLAKKHFDM